MSIKFGHPVGKGAGVVVGGIMVVGTGVVVVVGAGVVVRSQFTPMKWPSGFISSSSDCGPHATHLKVFSLYTKHMKSSAHLQSQTKSSGEVKFTAQRYRTALDQSTTEM